MQKGNLIVYFTIHFYYKKTPRVISGFHRDVDGICALLVCWAAYSGSFLTDILGQPIGSIFKGQELPITPEETSVSNCHSTLRNMVEERGSKKINNRR